MAFEPAGLDRMLGRISEIAARFAPPSPATDNPAPPAPAGRSGLPAASVAPATFATALQKAADATGLAPGLLSAVVHAESGGNPGEHSKAGAMGLMQLMPETARDMGVTNPWDPAQNLMGGARYLRQMIDEFGGDLPKGLAAYNAGPNAVKRHGGIPPFPETQQYVKQVLGLYKDHQP